MIQRIYSRFEGDRPYTELELSRLSEEEQVEVMVNWFLSRYQDPVHRLPYNSAEGGYQWVFGGPENADEVLQDEFSSFIDFKVIRKAVDEVEAEGTLEWSPMPDDDFFEDHPLGRGDFTASDFDANDFDVAESDGGDSPPPVTAKSTPENLEELKTRLASVLSDLEERLSEQLPKPGLGHNNPPEPIEDTPLCPNDISATISATASLRNEALSSDPDISTAKTRLHFLQGVAARLASWLGTRLTKGADAFIAAAGAAAGAKIVWSWQPIHDLLAAALDLGARWLHTIL